MKLLDWRAAQALTLAQLAEQVGVTKISLSRYERGERIPARKIMQKIVQVTGGSVKPNDFFDDQIVAPPSSDEPQEAVHDEGAPSEDEEAA